VGRCRCEDGRPREPALSEVEESRRSKAPQAFVRVTRDRGFIVRSISFTLGSFENSEG